jgi:predicted phage terminase large subunit-like protein
MPLLTENERKQKELVVQARAELARRHLIKFSPFVDPTYQTPSHLVFLSEKLEAVESGDIKRLMVFMPPREGKSETISRKFPAWFLGRHPDQNVIMSSYSYTLTRSFSKDVRDIVESRRYKLVFPLTTAWDSRSVNDWDIAFHKGGLLATGAGGSITGFGAHLFIIDDPVKNQEEADSIIVRDKLWDWYRSVVLTRMEPESRMVLVMARWNQDDLAGRILNSEKDWVVVNMPALAEKDDILGRKINQPLWPERYDRNTLEGMKSKLGSRIWSALYQGDPQGPESQKFKREWFQWYDVLPKEDSPLPRGGGVDTATSLKSSNDNTSLVDVCRDSKGFLYVDDVFCEKITVSGFAEHLLNQHAAKHYIKVNLEKNNAGEAFKQRIDEVSREKGISIPVECEQTSTDKMVRAMEFQPFVENGTLRFKRGSPRVAALVEHLINFDGRDADVDDDIDALGFAIKAVINKNEGAIFISTQDVY